MKNNGFFKLFTDELNDMRSAENQIIDALPKMIKLTSYPELKEALTHHLKETENQVTRIDSIFDMIGVVPKEITCEAMEGIIKEAKELVANKTKSPVLDAAIIAACQKVEHYEMASYGTLRSFAKHLDLSSEVIDLIQENLDEEGAADKKLTKLADGTFFKTGINEEAAVGNAKNRK